MREEVIEILSSICAGVDFENEDINIAEDLDSVDIIALIEELEDRFNVEITTGEKTEENFESVDALVEMLERLQ